MGGAGRGPASRGGRVRDPLAAGEAGGQPSLGFPSAQEGQGAAAATGPSAWPGHPAACLPATSTVGRRLAGPDPGRLLRPRWEHADDAPAGELAGGRTRHPLPLRASLLHLPVALVAPARSRRLAPGRLECKRGLLSRQGSGPPAAGAAALVSTRPDRGVRSWPVDVEPLLRARLAGVLASCRRTNPRHAWQRRRAALLRGEAPRHLELEARRAAAGGAARAPARPPRRLGLGAGLRANEPGGGRLPRGWQR